MSESTSTKSSGPVEWKVRIASFATFVGSLAAVALIETRGVEFVNELPEGVRIVVLPVLVAAGAWFAGRAARSKPDYLSASTIEAARARIGR